MASVRIPTGDPNIPENIRRAKEIDRLIYGRQEIHTGLTDDESDDEIPPAAFPRAPEVPRAPELPRLPVGLPLDPPVPHGNQPGPALPGVVGNEPAVAVAVPPPVLPLEPARRTLAGVSIARGPRSPPGAGVRPRVNGNQGEFLENFMAHRMIQDDLDRENEKRRREDDEVKAERNRVEERQAAARERMSEREDREEARAERNQQFQMMLMVLMGRGGNGGGRGSGESSSSSSGFPFPLRQPSNNNSGDEQDASAIEEIDDEAAEDAI